MFPSSSWEIQMEIDLAFTGGVRQGYLIQSRNSPRPCHTQSTCTHSICQEAPLTRLLPHLWVSFPAFFSPSLIFSHWNGSLLNFWLSIFCQDAFFVLVFRVAKGQDVDSLVKRQYENEKLLITVAVVTRQFVKRVFLTPLVCDMWTFFIQRTGLRISGKTKITIGTQTSLTFHRYLLSLTPSLFPSFYLFDSLLSLTFSHLSFLAFFGLCLTNTLSFL